MSADDIIKSDSPPTRLLAASLILAGEVVAFRTDTFYGLAADPLNPRAVKKVAKLKGRANDKPILVIIADRQNAERFISSESSNFKRLADRFWAGGLTIVEKAKEGLPPELVSQSGAIGLRLPKPNDVRDFVRLCGGALTATSANIAGAKPAETAHAAFNYFPHGLSLIVDGGATGATQPSTVVDVSIAEAVLLREGAVSRREIARIVKLRL